MAPCNGNGTVHLKVGHHPSSTLHWHPAMAPPPPPTIAHYNGTLQWHHVHSPKSSSQPQYTTMAPYNGTLQWYHVHCTLQWHLGVTSNPPKWFVALPPIGSKNPYSYRYLGNQESHHAKNVHHQKINTHATCPKKCHDKIHLPKIQRVVQENRNPKTAHVPKRGGGATLDSRDIEFHCKMYE